MTPHVATGTSSYRTVVHAVDVDEHVRLALLHSLTASGMELQAHAHLAEFLGAHRAERPGCLIIDAQSLGGNPVPPTMRCPIVVIACMADFAVVVSAMKAGAIDVVEKPPCPRKLAAAVNEAIGVDRQRRLAESHHAMVRARFATLSPRERQVMSLVTAGKLNKQVAADLCLSEITVKAHRGSAMRKMGARSLAELVRMADVIGEAMTTTTKNERSGPVRSGAFARPHSGCTPAPG